MYDTTVKKDPSKDAPWQIADNDYFAIVHRLLGVVFRDAQSIRANDKSLSQSLKPGHDILL